LLYTRLVRWARLDRLGPDPSVSHRAIVLAFAARFVDEVTSGAWLVLAPTFRRVFRLSLVQVSLLAQVVNWVALLVEPPSASLIDLTSRRRLMAFGSAALGVSMVTIGASPSFATLLVGLALFGVGSGPLAHTADVLIVESFPEAAERAFTRSTFVDTTGALVGPALVAAAAFLGVTWRAVPAGVGALCLVYAVALAATPMPPPPGLRESGWGVVLQSLRTARRVLGRPEVRRALLLLVCFELFEAAFVLKYVWLHDAVGLSQAEVAAWAAAEQVVDLVALVVLDRWLRTVAAPRVLRLAAAALTVLPVAWILAPGIWGRIVVGIPLSFAHTLIWPLAKSRSLVAAPDTAGAVQAISALIPLLPLAVAQGWLSERVGAGTAIAVTAAAGAAAMLVAVWAATDPV
jgi:MFS family permease